MIRRRNWLRETKSQEHERRIAALEAHIQDLEERLNERVSYLLMRTQLITGKPVDEPLDKEMFGD